MIVVAACVATSVVIASVAVLVIARRTADGRIGRNQLAGIRTRATLASDEAWLAGHGAARTQTERGALVGIAGGVLGLLVAFVAPAPGLVLAGAAALAMLVGVVGGAASGHRAARAVARPDDR